MSTPLDDFPGACDCHVHVYDSVHPLAPTATFKPPHAPASAYRDVQSALGLQRVVVVQPTGYGFDNGCTLDAIAQLGAGARGVAVVPPEVTEAELARLHAAGMRGVRFMMLAGGALQWTALDSIASKIAPLGWNINLQLSGHDLPAHEAVLARLPCSLVIDHLGKFLGAPAQPGDAGLQSLLRLLDSGRCWIKLSAPYESSLSGPPAYADVATLAQHIARSHPERCLWASNWPHPNIKPEPSNLAMLDWILQQVPDALTRQRMLVDNPAALYGF